MSYTSSVTYSGVNNQNVHRLKDIKKAENAAEAYYNLRGSTIERTSYWNVDANGNVSHFAHVRREDKLNEKLRKEANEKAKELIEKNREKNGVSYESTIGDSVLQDMSDNAEKIRKEKMEERKLVEEVLKEHFGDRFKCFQVKWQEEIKQEEVEKVEALEEATETESESVGGMVGVNVGKTARKIEAAKTKTQLRAVIAEITGDMQEVKAGIEKGWCDESEMEKVNSLMSMAQNKMGQVEDREATPEEENMFAMASLM